MGNGLTNLTTQPRIRKLSPIGCHYPNRRKMNKVEAVFHVNYHYEYFRNKVTYVKRCDTYYHFDLNGGNLKIDTNHTHLIFGRRIEKKFGK
jgi:hypothetical protein